MSSHRGPLREYIRLELTPPERDMVKRLVEREIETVKSYSITVNPLFEEVLEDTKAIFVTRLQSLIERLDNQQIWLSPQESTAEVVKDE